MNVVIFFILGIVLSVLIHTVKHKMFTFTYFSGMAVVRDFVWSVLLGFVGALILMTAADSLFWNAKQAITKPFQKTYTYDTDFIPSSQEPQYNMVTPGVPWSGVWRNASLDSNWTIRNSICLYPQYADESPEYFITQEQTDGSTLIVYYTIQSSVSQGDSVVIQDIYNLSADGATLTDLFETDGTSSEYDTVYTRPEKSAANALPETLWGYWESLPTSRDSGGTFERWYVIDAFRIDQFSGGVNDNSLAFSTGFYADRIDVKKADGATEYDLTIEPLDNDITLRYYVENGTEKIDVVQGGVLCDTLLRLPEETCAQVAETVQARNMAPAALRAYKIQQQIDESSDSETKATLQAQYEIANRQAEEQAGYTGSILDLLRQPLSSLTAETADASSVQTDPAASSGQNSDNPFASLDVPVASLDVAIEDPLSLLWVPGISVITVNGQPVQAALYIDGSAAIEKSAVTQECTVLRCTYPDENGYRSGSAVVNPGDTSATFVGTAISDETGKGQADGEELTMLMNAYYAKYLQAINEQDTSVLCMITDTYREEILSRVTSDANRKNYYDPAQFQIEISDGAIRYGGDFWENENATLYFNMKVDFVTQDRETQQTESMTNYQTVLMRWEDGMWKVDNSDFITQDEYNGNTFADFVI